MNNNANTLSTTVRGANFEKNVYKKLRNMKLHVTQTGASWDNGIDMYSSYKDHILIIQCKAYTNNVGPESIRGFKGTLTNYFSEYTLGVFVVLNKSCYTEQALLEAQTTPDRHRILLTDIQSLCDDLINYPLYPLQKHEKAMVNKIYKELIIMKRELKEDRRQRGNGLETTHFLLGLLIASIWVLIVSIWVLIYIQNNKL